MARVEPMIALSVTAAMIRSQSDYLVVKPDGTIYAFFVDSANDLYYAKSDDEGFTWAPPVLVRAGTLDTFSVWYDRWSGIDADLIHIAYMDDGADDIFYKQLDAATDSLGSEITVFAGGSVAVGTDICISITRARGGYIYVMADLDGGTEVTFERSDDAGATFDALTGSVEGADYFLLAPGFAADNNDIMCIFWDRSADEISRKVYDQSGDSWAETSIAASMADVAVNLASPQFAISVDLVNSKVLLIAWSARDTLNATLRFWTVTEAAISSPVTIVTSTDDQQCCALVLDTDTGDLYAFYCGKTDGSETVGTATGIYYKVSADDGATWGSEQTLVSTQRNYDHLVAALRYDSSVGGFAVAFEVQSTLDAMRISAEHPAAAGGGAAQLVNSGGLVG